MGLVKYGGGVIQISGSIGGNTFARNRFGNYIRARTKPINPNTSGQQAVRNALADLTTRWSSVLTDVQRIAWNLYASNTQMTNRLGEAIYLTGFNHFIRSNSILLREADTLVYDGPTTFELPAQDGLFAVTISEAAQEISVVFDVALPWVDENQGKLWIFMGSPQNAQRNFFGGPWKYAGSESGDSTTPPTSPVTIPCPFVATEGQRIWVYARIQREDGRLSQKFRSDIIVAV